MKVLLCEISLDGHRQRYLNELTQIDEIDFYAITPGNTVLHKDHSFFYSFNKQKSLFEYLLWIKAIKRIVLENKIDVVHFLDGDSIMRYFGLGFNSIRCKRIVITYHHFFDGLLRKMSYRLMNYGKNRISVVHTETFKRNIEKYGIKAIQCNYPAFQYNDIVLLNNEKCRKDYGLISNIPTIGIIGSVCSYKHIIPFLKIMNNCNTVFHLLICGKTSDVSADEIYEATSNYKDKVVYYLKYLNDEEYYKAIAASDIVYSVYGLDFNGASGPLTDGVCAKKMILSSSHGSLGEIVTENHLGIVADVTDDSDILEKTEKALKTVERFSYDETAMQYRERIKPENFRIKYKDIYNSWQNEIFITK